MATVPPRPERRRARPGSLERPVNGRLYRGTWLLVGLPLLVAAFSVARPAPLPRAFPPEFDGAAAKQLASELAELLPGPLPGDRTRRRGRLVHASSSAVRPAGPSGELQRRDPGPRARAHAEPRRRGRRPLAGPIVVMAHRDNTGVGQGANDNASGTAMLVQLARAYGSPPGFPSGRLRPNHTIVFLSTDGGAYGGLGADLVRRALAVPPRHGAVINLDSVGGKGAAAPAARRRHAAHSVGHAPGDGRRPRREPDGAARRSDRPAAPARRPRLPVLALRAGALPRAGSRRDHADDRRATCRPSPTGDTRERLEHGRARPGRALGTGSSRHARRGARVRDREPRATSISARACSAAGRIELVLIACLLPFLAAAIDLFARCRRRRIPLAPALRSLRSRLVLLDLGGGAVRALRLLRRVARRCTAPARAPERRRDRLARAVVRSLLDRARPRRLARHPRAAASASRRDEHRRSWPATRSHCSASGRSPCSSSQQTRCTRLPAALPARLALAAAGESGEAPGTARRSPSGSQAQPAARLVRESLRLGWDAPWYLAELRVVGYVPFIVMPLLVIWLAGQCAARGPRGPPLRAVSGRVRAAAARSGAARPPRHVRSPSTTAAATNPMAAAEALEG